MALTGTEIPIGIYSWIAIVVFPINSAVNPILYTLSARVQKKVKTYMLQIKVKENSYTEILNDIFYNYEDNYINKSTH